MHFMLGCFDIFLKKIKKKKKEGKGKTNVFCIIFLEFEIKISYIIST